MFVSRSRSRVVSRSRSLILRRAENSRKLEFKFSYACCSEQIADACCSEQIVHACCSEQIAWAKIRTKFSARRGANRGKIFQKPRGRRAKIFIYKNPRALYHIFYIINYMAPPTTLHINYAQGR